MEGLRASSTPQSIGCTAASSATRWNFVPRASCASAPQPGRAWKVHFRFLHAQLQTGQRAAAQLAAKLAAKLAA
jgi:hypothetical protein